MGEQQPLSGLNRRDFLKVAAQISAAGLTMALLTEIPARMSRNVSPAPVQAEALGRKFSFLVRSPNAPLWYTAS